MRWHSSSTNYLPTITDACLFSSPFSTIAYYIYIRPYKIHLSVCYDWLSNFLTNLNVVCKWALGFVSLHFNGDKILYCHVMIMVGHAFGWDTKLTIWMMVEYEANYTQNMFASFLWDKMVSYWCDTQLWRALVCFNSWHMSARLRKHGGPPEIVSFNGQLEEIYIYFIRVIYRNGRVIIEFILFCEKYVKKPSTPPEVRGMSCRMYL